MSGGGIILIRFVFYQVVVCVLMEDLAFRPVHVFQLFLVTQIILFASPSSPFFDLGLIKVGG